MSFSVTEGDPAAFDVTSSPADVFEAISALKRQQRLLGSDHLSDAKFLVGPEKETATVIPVHSFLLRLASEPFDAMFSGNWIKEDGIHIPDTDADTMYSLLRWIYCQQLVIRSGRLTDVLMLANKYAVTSLIRLFKEHDMDCYVWQVLNYALRVGDDDLIELCEEEITADPYQYFNAIPKTGLHRRMQLSKSCPMS